MLKDTPLPPGLESHQAPHQGLRHDRYQGGAAYPTTVIEYARKLHSGTWFGRPVL